MSFLEVLLLGSYAYTSACFCWVFKIYKELTNHRRTELKAHLKDECEDDCFYCD